MTLRPLDSCLDQNVLHAHTRERAAMSLRATHALASLLLEHADLRTAGFAVDDADDLGVGDERRAGQHLAVLLEQQHAIDADLVARLRVDAIDGDERAGHDLYLPAAALNDCVHAGAPCGENKTLGYHRGAA